MTEENMNNHESMESSPQIHGATKVGFTTRRDVEHGILYVGIDLGTSQTVISASNGTRSVVESLSYPIITDLDSNPADYPILSIITIGYGN